MDIQNMLKQYRSLRCEVAELNGIISEQVNPTAILQLTARLAICNRLLSDTDNFVMSLPDSLARRVLQCKYIDGQYPVSWQQVARSIGGGNSADTVRMLARRTIKSHR